MQPHVAAAGCENLVYPLPVTHPPADSILVTDLTLRPTFSPPPPSNTHTPHPSTHILFSGWGVTGLYIPPSLPSVFGLKSFSCPLLPAVDLSPFSIRFLLQAFFLPSLHGGVGVPASASGGEKKAPKVRSSF